MRGEQLHLGISDQQDASKKMMVEKSCESCREWQEHYYWSHMGASKISFFKLMTGDFDKGISIPEKFVKNFKVPKEVDLKVTNGEKWRIGLEKRGSEVCLSSGWVDFIKAQELQENDLLIFTCSDHSSFDVLIFEQSGCIKVSSLFGPSICRHFNDTAGRHAEHYSPSDSDDTRVPSPLPGSRHNASTLKKSSGSDPGSPNSRSGHVKHEAIAEEESDDIYADSKYYYSRAASQLADNEKEEILGLAPTRSDNPVFVTILLKSQCRRRCNTLIIPGGFAADHLEAREHHIILRRVNRKDKWAVRYYYTTYHGCFRNLQFFRFVHENKLREGDICVFELMKGVKRVTMTVHVIRKKADGRFVLVV